ncbi:MAG TPA: hypothetical protein VER55_14215 [Ardenticatenaceae bacterium]|nr:hypothetical protein [Ardenticatenaceae bacterium]
MAWGDVDGDGDLDLAAGNYLGIRLYLNARDHRLSPAASPRLRIARPEPAPAADFYSSATILSGPAVPIRYWLLDRDSSPVKSIRAFYSLDGGGHWQPAIAAADTLTVNLETSPGGTPHTYTWDLYASGVMGQSDNVVFRLEAVPAITGAPHGVAGPFQFGASAADTFPFRVRGSQVRVLSDTIPMPNALVYRLTGRETVGGKPYADLTGEPFRTDSQGYLQGRGRIRLGDRLVALLPVHHTRSYDLYYTSAAPVESGLRAYPVRAGGVQTLTVSAANPLLLFNLDVALEWDARRDTQYLSQLTFDLQRASAFLYDWSDGQVALGALRIFPDARHNHYDRETPSTPSNTVLAESPPAEWDAWLNAHVRIYATNRLRPNAAQGGIVDAPLGDPSSAGVQYEPGQVRMGAVWNRFGEPHGSLGEDWPRTLAHELGHYALFLDDNYLGLDASGLLVSIESCPGAMSDPYRDDYYSEFHPRAGWLPGCERTLSNLATGRSDWATIKSFYPWLAEPATTIDALNQGPHVLPLEITTIQTVEPLTPSQALAIPIFYLTHAGARARTGGARAILFQEDRLTDLGSPVLDRVEARGARPGDRLCVYDLEQARLGCETIRRGDEQLALATQPDWKPEVIVWPTAPTTISVSVTNVPPGLPLRARLFPVSDPASPAIPLRESARGYEGLFTLEQPALEGYVHVWVDGSQPLRETVGDYALGAGPGYTRGRGGYTRGRGGYTRGRGAPVSSADGQVVLFDESLRLRRDDVLAMQALASIPSPPLWASPVGRAYRLSATPGLDVTGGSISFNYLGSEVLPAEEQWLAIFFWDGHEWQRLATKTDLYHNVASAPAAGAGIYALMSSIAMPLLQPGWNLFAYPVQSVRPVTEALSSIHGSYTSVYGYVVTDTLNPWRLYSPEVPDWVNDLHAFEFGKGYWIHTSHAITVQLRAPSIGSLASSDGGFANPPATYYGRVQAGPQFQPRAGQPVRAWIDGTLCGQAETREVGGELVYRIHVLAVAPGAAAGCGTPGRQVTFQVGSQWMATDVWWNNNRPWNLPLSNRMRLFIPMLE